MAGLCWAMRATRLAVMAQHRSAQHYEDTYYLPRAEHLPLLSLGFQPALADLLWCKSLVYFGEEVIHRGIVHYLFQYTDAILALDPTLRSAYSWVPTAAMFRPGQVSREDGLHAASYLERAVKRWPDDGELRWDYGSLLQFELAPRERDPARKRALLERAAPQLELAARMGAGPAWLALNSAELLNKLGRTEQAIRHLEELRATVSEPAVQSEIDRKLKALRTHSYLEAVDTAEQQFEEARLRSYPYLSSGLYLFVGDPLPSYEAFVTGGFSSDP
jgi:tetratricopeptide (TPR) repeat protein